MAKRRISTFTPMDARIAAKIAAEKREKRGQAVAQATIIIVSTFVVLLVAARAFL